MLFRITLIRESCCIFAAAVAFFSNGIEFVLLCFTLLKSSDDCS